MKNNLLQFFYIIVIFFCISNSFPLETDNQTPGVVKYFINHKNQAQYNPRDHFKSLTSLEKASKNNIRLIKENTNYYQPPNGNGGYTTNINTVSSLSNVNVGTSLIPKISQSYQDSSMLTSMSSSQGNIAQSKQNQITTFQQNLINSGAMILAKSLMGFKHPAIWHTVHCLHIPYFNTVNERPGCVSISGFFYNVSSGVCEQVDIPCGDISTLNFFKSGSRCNSECLEDGEGKDFLTRHIQLIFYRR